MLMCMWLFPDGKALLPYFLFDDVQTSQQPLNGFMNSKLFGRSFQNVIYYVFLSYRPPSNKFCWQCVSSKGPPALLRSEEHLITWILGEMKRRRPPFDEGFASSSSPTLLGIRSGRGIDRHHEFPCCSLYY